MLELDKREASDGPTHAEQLKRLILDLFDNYHQPSAHELLQKIEKDIGLEARWKVTEVVTRLSTSLELTISQRECLRSLLDSGSLAKALRGEGAPAREMISTIDLLLEQSNRYKSSSAFREMIEFMGRFRDYAPYNNMLVRIQSPCCGFYATARDWQRRFSRRIREDASPMLILAPMHPVMLVYGLDQTEGAELPEELRRFARFKGDWEGQWLERLIENAAGNRIQVQLKALHRRTVGSPQ